MAKFNSTADLATSKIISVAKNNSAYVENDIFKEIKLSDQVPVFTGTFREKKNVLENFDV